MFWFRPWMAAAIMAVVVLFYFLVLMLTTRFTPHIKDPNSAVVHHNSALIVP